MTTGHIVLEDAIRPLITLKIGQSMTIQQMPKRKKKRGKRHAQQFKWIMIKGLKGYPFNEQGFRQESRCQNAFYNSWRQESNVNSVSYRLRI